MFGQRLQLVKSALLVTSFEFGKDSFVISLPGGDEMEKDTGQFVGGVLYSLQCTVACTLGPVVVAQERFVVVKALSRHTKFLSDSVSSLDLRPTNAAAGAGAVLRTEVEPGGEAIGV